MKECLIQKIAKQIKDEDAINCISTGVPELEEWGRNRIEC